MSFIQDLKTLLEHGDDLPTLPDVVLELQAAFNDEMIGDVELAAIIERDPALTARMLRVANSAMFRRGDPVASVSVAVQRMGIRQVRATCLVLGVVKSFEGAAGGLDHQQFWNHSAAVGLAAQRLWRLVPGVPSSDADQLYVAGLLHDVGLLVLDQFFPDRLREVNEHHELSGEPRPACERIVLGMDHGAVGSLLLGRWSLPESIVAAVADHHQPAEAPEAHAAAACVVAAAEQVCAGLGWDLEGERDEPAVMTALTALGLESGTIEQFETEIEQIASNATGFLVV